MRDADTRRRLAVVACAVCSVIAVVWLVVVPSSAHTTDGLQSLVLRFGHSTVWLLLALAAGAYAAGRRRASERLAEVALFAYLAFVVAIVT